MTIRKALIKDIPAIHKLLNHYGDQGLLLPRSLSELYDHVRDFFVLENEGQGPATSPDPGESLSGPELIGVCALGICWEDLAEIKSLAVREENQGKGLGSRLVAECLDDARHLGLKKVFTLTYVPGFFIRQGFQEVEKSVLPHKIWADCLKCPKFPDCDETALMIDL
jgi:amino-acid N-acetyltransferase